MSEGRAQIGSARCGVVLLAARDVEDPTSGARFVERRSSSVVARRHPSFRPTAGTIASRPLEQGSPWIVRFLRAIHDARETMSATEVGSSMARACQMRQHRLA
jgi:hypothetical protein